LRTAAPVRAVMTHLADAFARSELFAPEVG